MDKSLPPLRPKASLRAEPQQSGLVRSENRASTGHVCTGLSDSSNGTTQTRCPCMSGYLVGEIHEIRAKLDGLQQVMAGINVRLDLLSYPLASIEEGPQHEPSTSWCLSYNPDAQQTTET
ncbi:hypothetical protein GGR57DRAFT_497960 [Xylariaceae sp. FL1272]|nr:hypothetical protein GGR57DRAFT_497960 [Xylariaceae sp. FL1272]